MNLGEVYTLTPFSNPRLVKKFLDQSWHKGINTIDDHRVSQRTATATPNPEHNLN